MIVVALPSNEITITVLELYIRSKTREKIFIYMVRMIFQKTQLPLKNKTETPCDHPKTTSQHARKIRKFPNIHCYSGIQNDLKFQIDKRMNFRNANRCRKKIPNNFGSKCNTSYRL